MDAVSELQATIAAVFADVPRPAPDALLHPQCFDRVPVAPFREWTSWQEIPREVLSRNYDGLSFFSPAAFRFFLPAFMTATLELFRTSTDFVSDATVFELNPHTDYARSRYALFTRDESAVVAAFLELMVAHPQHADAALAQSALDGHWTAASRGAPAR